MKASFQLDDDVASIIGVLARAAGMSRSAWIRRAVMDAIPARPDEVRYVPGDQSGTTKMVSLRLPVEDIAAMEQVAHDAGLTRAEWIKRTLRWQLWNRASELRLMPESQQNILQVTAQLRAMGRSLNQAVKAMNMANRPDSPLEIQSAARSVLAMRDELSVGLESATEELAAIMAGEVQYWTQGDPQTRLAKGVLDG